MSQVALQRSLSDVVDEYTEKRLAAPAVVAALAEAEKHARAQAVVGANFGGLSSLRLPSVRDIEQSLKVSAWGHVYNGLNISTIAGAADRKRIKLALENPPDFTLENIRETFGDYVKRPRFHILKGLAEVFCNLDPAFKSHTKMRIGVKGLPKRVIISGFGGYSDWGRDRLHDMLKAIAAYEGKPAPTFEELRELAPLREDKIGETRGHGVRVRSFANGNAHIFFDPETLKTVNKALAEFYGDVLPDVDPENPEKKPSTAVSKDLQYYPTPKAVVDWVMGETYIREGAEVLEPSCGCGRFLDALRAAGANATGIEYHPGRAAESRAKGHRVMVGNFLEVTPDPRFDVVVMNPPFYGKHYAKHVNHAMKFLRPKGQLIAILPASARYDHGLLDGQWRDLPIGSFAESGTNINTVVLKKWAEA